MTGKKHLLTALAYGACLALPFLGPAGAAAQDRRPIELTVESAAELAMASSFRVQQLRMDIERQRYALRAEQAGLKSRVELSFNLPQFSSISEPRWNSTLRRNELVREDSRLWQAELSIRQPVVLFGYPTNGYLSLNNEMYRYSQLGDDAHTVEYYNRYYVEYEQPLFQPNQLKNAIEDAKLDLQRAELDYQGDVIDLLASVSRDYYGLLDIAYRQVTNANQVTQLEAALAVARQHVNGDSTRALDVTQVQVALANAREQLQSANSDFRLAASRMKQRLGLGEADSLAVGASLRIVPITIDEETAIRHALTLPPRLRELEIRKRQDELNLDAVRARNSFRLNIEATYGREVENTSAANLWRDPENSYTVGVRGYLPLWDWGAREARIAAQQVSMKQTELQIEETERQIRANVQNLVRSVAEYQQRALAMEENLRLSNEISASNLERYGQGRSSVLEVLQSFDRESDTAGNFLEAFLGYRRALVELQQATYFDFEANAPLSERHRLGDLGVRNDAGRPGT